MKRSKKILSMLMAFVMVFSLLPAVAPTAEAAQVESWDDLRTQLGASGSATIKLGQKLKGESVDENPDSARQEYNTPFDTIEVHGNKTLDLNGQEIYYKDKSILTTYYSIGSFGNTQYKAYESHTTMFQIMPGAVLTIMDSSQKGSGKIRFDSQEIDNEYDDQNWGLHRRDVFKISDGGKLVINGGTIESGSTHKQWLINAEEIEPRDPDNNGYVDTVFQYYESAPYGYRIHNGNGRFDGYARYLVCGTPVHVGSGGQLVVNGGDLIGRGSSLLNESESYDLVEGQFQLVRDEVIHVEKDASVYINGGSFTGLGGANLFAGEGASGSNVIVRDGLFEVDKHDHIRACFFRGYRTDLAFETPNTQIAMVGSFGSSEVPGVQTDRTVGASLEKKKNWDDKTQVTTSEYGFKHTAERKLTVNGSSRDAITWDGMSSAVIKDPYQRYFMDPATIDGYQFQFKWYIYQDSALNALEQVLTKNVGVGDITNQNQLDLKSLDIDWTKSDDWTVVCEAVEVGPEDTISSDSKPIKINLVPYLTFVDQDPSTDLGNVKVGVPVIFKFNNNTPPEGYFVTKTATLKGLFAGLDETVTVGPIDTSSALPLNHTFQNAGMYQVVERLQMYKEGDTSKPIQTKTQTFLVTVSKQPTITPTITSQPVSVTNAPGDSVTLTASAKDATAARWYKFKSDGTMEALGADFNNGTSTQTIKKSSNAPDDKYGCSFWSETGKIASSERVTVCFAPTVTGSNVTVTAGQTAYLKVDAEGCGHFDSATGWYRADSKLTAGDKYYPMGTTLAIQNVQESDAGTYTYKYRTHNGTAVTGTVKLVVNAGSASATINSFDIYGLDNPVIVGTAADTSVSVPDGANYTVGSVTWYGVNSSGIMTSSSGSAKIILKANAGYTFESGDLVGMVDGLPKTVYSVPANATEITVTVDYNNYSSWKVAYPEADPVSITTESLSFQANAAASGQKLEGTFTCDHKNLAEINMHHTGMTYQVYDKSNYPMPAGLTLNQDGTITGTPTTTGVYTVMVIARSVNASGNASNSSGLVVKAIELVVQDEDTHICDKTIVANTATCGADGEMTYKCGCKVFAPALGHDWGKWTVTKPATCTENGEQQSVCKHDSSHINTAVILAKDHTPSSAWEKNDETHWKTCSSNDCGTVIQGTLGNHMFNGDLVCDTCGYKHVHSYTAGEYEGNLEKHWQVCDDANCPDVSGSSRSAEAHQVDANTGTCSVCGAVIGEAVIPTNPFTDVPAGAYYEDAVLWALENNITTGLTDTTFGPDKTCTRAQAVTFLWRAAGSPAPASTDMPFTDVASGAYYYNAVLWAVEKGITNGTSATTFGPDATCVRGQIVTFLWRSQGQPAVDGSNPFTDVADSAYYYDAVLWAVKEGVTSGTSSTTFSPNSNCTRAQIVTFLYRCMGE